MPNFDGPDFDDSIDDDTDIETMEDMVRANKSTRKRTVKKTVNNLPTLVMVGNHLVDPHDVACITKVNKKSNLYIVRLKSQPNMEYPIWVNGDDIGILMRQFNITVED